MENAQLFQHFKDAGITIEDISEKTGYALGYLVNLMHGRAPVSDGARFRFIQAFPETADFLLERDNDRESPPAAQVAEGQLT